MKKKKKQKTKTAKWRAQHKYHLNVMFVVYLFVSTSREFNSSVEVKRMKIILSPIILIVRAIFNKQPSHTLMFIKIEIGNDQLEPLDDGKRSIISIHWTIVRTFDRTSLLNRIDCIASLFDIWLVLTVVFFRVELWSDIKFTYAFDTKSHRNDEIDSRRRQSFG